MLSGLSPRARRNIGRIVPFGVIWLVFSQVFLISDYGATGSFSEVPETAIQVDPWIYLFATLAVTLVGLLVGAVELLFLARWFAARSLGIKLIGKTGFYMVFLMVVILITFPIAAAMEMGTSLAHPMVWRRLGEFLFSATALSTGVQLTASLVASLFYAEISEHLGAQILRNFLTGRYHTPKEERRVFLFCDMKSSTSFAEQLGHARYFDLLKAYYDSLSEAIVDHDGEVYQYIGDEIVVSWPEESGVRGNQCIHCVLRMKQDLQARSSMFLDRFGVIPDFKAGLQLGAVTTGEIGALKKEIVFTGDVLNQTARIQAKCNELGADLLVGRELRARLGSSADWQLSSVGSHALRGKEQTVELFRLVWPLEAGPYPGHPHT